MESSHRPAAGRCTAACLLQRAGNGKFAALGSPSELQRRAEVSPRWSSTSLAALANIPIVTVPFFLRTRQLADTCWGRTSSMASIFTFLLLCVCLSLAPSFCLSRILSLSLPPPLLRLLPPSHSLLSLPTLLLFFSPSSLPPLSLQWI